MRRGKAVYERFLDGYWRFLKRAVHVDLHPLLSDADGTVATMMGVARKKGPPKRVTFVIDQNRRVVEVVKSEIRMSVHADRALDALKQLQR